jgi:hypothetical protein
VESINVNLEHGMPVSHTATHPRWETPALLVVLIVGVLHDVIALFRFPVAVGVDGYYYILQITHLESSGRLYFPSKTPFLLYILTGFNYLIHDPVLAVKLSSITLHTLLCLGIFAIITTLTKSQWLGILGAALTSISGVHFYLVGEYINNLGALTALVWSSWFALRAVETRRKIWMLASSIIVLLSIFSHRSALALVLLIVVSAALVYFTVRVGTVTRARRLILAGTILFLWSSPAILSIQPFIHLPGWLASQLSFIPKVQFAGLFDTPAEAEQIILSLIIPLTLFALFLRRRKGQLNFSCIVLGSISLFGILITINPFFNNTGGIGLTWRLGILAYIQVAILVPGLCWLTALWQRHAPVFIMAFVAPLMVASACRSYPSGMQTEFLARRVILAKHLPDCKQQLQTGPIVISPHGDEFLVTWALGVPSQQTPPANNAAKTVYWLLRGVRPQSLEPSMVVVASTPDERYVVLVKDDNIRRKLLAPTEETAQLLLDNYQLLEHFEANVMRIR